MNAGGAPPACKRDPTNEDVRVEYIEARRVLLDALEALKDQLDAVVLVGAQAVYLRTTNRLPTYQPFTTDADIVLDPNRLSDRPALGAAMRGAGLVLTSEPGIWEARFKRAGFEEEIVVPVDLIVPMHIASGAGRRSARLGADHGKSTARKSEGLEGVLVEHSTIEIRAVDRADNRTVTVNVAGEAALVIAKLHKLGDRLDKPARLDAKDAGDVYRLFDVVASDDLAIRFRMLLADPRSTNATEKALVFGDRLFGGATSVGTRLGIEALRAVVPEATASAVLTTYWRILRETLAGSVHCRRRAGTRRSHRIQR